MSYGFQPPPHELSYSNGVQPQQGQAAVIRNVESGLVLEATDFEIKLQQYTGSPYQLWTFEPIGDGKFIIKNRGNGNALDIEGGAECGAKVITYEQHGEENQQWFILEDKSIVSGAATEVQLALDIYEGECVAGNYIIAYDKHGGANQQFVVEYQ